MLFADIRGFTAWSETASPSVATQRLTRFYEQAGRVLTQDDAFMEFVGDQVMAFYLPDIPTLGESTADVMVSAAQRLLGETRDTGGEALPIGVGIHMGIASVGNVSKGSIKDFTVVGDVVNTAARLQGCALAGQIVLSDRVYEESSPGHAEARAASFEVKGKAEPVRAHVIDAPSGPH